MIKIILIEDNTAYRKSIGWALEQTTTMQLTQSFGTASVALRKIPELEAQERPDLILLDLNLPGLSGLDALPQLRALLPDTPLIILTQSDMQADVLRAIELGAAGYLLKASSVPRILEGIKMVYDGGATLDPGLAALIIQSIRRGSPKKHPTVELSNRELDVITRIAEGSVQKEIADQLCLSSYTVNEYIANIYKKLKVHNAPAAIAKAYKTGILP